VLFLFFSLFEICIVTYLSPEKNISSVCFTLTFDLFTFSFSLRVSISAMARTGIFHHFGTFLLLAAWVLLLVTSISSPVVNDLSILKVTLTNRSDVRFSSVTFGSFGHCVLDVAPAATDQDSCSSSTIGYKPAVIMAEIDHTTFSHGSRDTADDLTNAMILHPIACAIAFLAFLLALGAGVIGSVFAAMVAAVAWIVTLVVMAIDFALFAIIKNHVNSDGSGSHAFYGPAMWTCMAAMICLFFGMVIILVTCCSSRMHRNDNKAAESGYVARTRRRRFWERR